MCTLCCWDVSLWPTLVNYTNLAFFWILIIVSLIWVFDLSCLCCFPAKWLYFPALVYIGSYARYLYVSHWVSVNLFWRKSIFFLSLCGKWHQVLKSVTCVCLSSPQSVSLSDTVFQLNAFALPVVQRWTPETHQIHFISFYHDQVLWLKTVEMYCI